MQQSQVPTLPSFEELDASVHWEAVGRGRHMAIVVVPDSAGRIPLVRSTAICTQPMQVASDLHRRLIESVQQVTGGPGYNNCMFEKYTPQYTRMGWHSDCDLDLAPGSNIAIVSAYSPGEQPWRRCVLTRGKEDRGAAQFWWLRHGSVAWFDTASNQLMQHKIIATPPSGVADEPQAWIGITMRRSKTWVAAEQLHLADSEQQAQFYAARAEQNRCCGPYTWPPVLHWTISPGDTLAPIVKK